MTSRLLNGGAVLVTGQPVYMKNMGQYTAEVHWGPDQLLKGAVLQLEGLHNDSARSFDMTSGRTALYVRQTALAEGR